MIDFEEGRISVRLSEGTYYCLQRDVAKFCFLSADGSCNENGFYNTILPRLHEKRVAERKRLHKVLTKRFIDKIKPEFKNEVLNELDDVFNVVLYEDKGTRYHHAKIDIRLSKENMSYFADIFSLLKAQCIPKSAYIRNLLNQYTTMRTEERECICYAKEFAELWELSNENAMVEYLKDGYVENMILVTVDLCCYDNELYVVGIVWHNEEAMLKAYRLCEFKRYKILYEECKIDEELLKQADALIADFKYYDCPSLVLERK